MTDLWSREVTVYIVTNNSEAKYRREVIKQCSVQCGYKESMDGTIRNMSDVKTVYTKDIARYLPPSDYFNVSASERMWFHPNGCYTVRTGDFIIFGKVDDAVSNPKEFADLQVKYKDCGMKVTSVNVNIFGMASDNIMMTNA